MIDKFFKQTKNTIWSFLSETGKSKDVYSCYSFLELEGYTMFFYAIPTEIVLLCLDIVDEGMVEYADEGIYRNVKKEGTYKYFRKILPDGSVSKNYRDWRISPIVELFEHACRMREFFAISGQFNVVPAIHLMYLTNSHIINYPKVVKTWQQDTFGISVLQNLQELAHANIYQSRIEGNPFILVNENLSIEGSEYWTKWQTYLKNRGWFDWVDPRWDDLPRPSDRRYSWKKEMGHLISDEFKE